MSDSESFSPIQSITLSLLLTVFANNRDDICIGFPFFTRKKVKLLKLTFGMWKEEFFSYYLYECMRALCVHENVWQKTFCNVINVFSNIKCIIFAELFFHLRLFSCSFYFMSTVTMYHSNCFRWTYHTYNIQCSYCFFMTQCSLYSTKWMPLLLLQVLKKKASKKATKKKREKKSRKDVNVVIMCSHVASASVVMYLWGFVTRRT